MLNYNKVIVCLALGNYYDETYSAIYEVIQAKVKASLIGAINVYGLCNSLGM